MYPVRFADWLAHFECFFEVIIKKITIVRFELKRQNIIRFLRDTFWENKIKNVFFSIIYIFYYALACPVSTKRGLSYETYF